VEGIPTLVFVKADTGEVITTEGREMVSAEPDAFPWPPKARTVLPRALGSINEVATLIMFAENCTDAAAEVAAVEALDAVAGAHFVDGKPSARLRFTLATSESSEEAASVRRFLGPTHMRDKDGDAAIRVTIVDIPKGKKYLWNDGKLAVPTEADLTAFVAAFLAGTAPSKGLKE
jgi:hypothetical protein